MARSIETIFNLIIAEKEATPELAALDSTSATSIYRLWAWITAAVIYTVEILFDLYKTEISALLQSLKPGTLLWYQELGKKFQYGDNLQWNSGNYGYPNIDSTKMIIAQCSVTEGSGGLVMKVAKEVTGELEPISETEYSAFVNYMSRRKYAGVNLAIISSSANLLTVNGTIIYNPLVITADGMDIKSGTRTVDLAIAQFLKELPFNGRLKISALTDAIQKVEGVEDVLVTAAHKYGAGSYQDIIISTIPESGYFKLDPAQLPETTLNYNPNV